jgi:hypothetical protein
MRRIQLSPNLFLDELVDPVTYFTEADNGLSKIDPSLIDIFQLLRDKYGATININGWWKHLPVDMVVFDPNAFLELMIAKKVPVWSGYRSPLCKIGASKSAHKKGKAIDPKGDEKKFMQIVRDNAKQFYDLGLRRLEDIKITNGWLHMDTLEQNTQPNSLRVVDLKKCTETIYL